MPCWRVMVLLGQPWQAVQPDGVGYTEIDMQSGEARMWSDPPDTAERADEEAFGEFLHQHPVAAYHERNGGQHAVQLADFLTRRQLHRLELYSDFYAPLEIEHQLAISVDAPGPIAVPISVHRDRREFSERDRAIMALLHPHLENAHRQLAAQLAARRLLEVVGEARGAAVISLGHDDRIELATGSARRWLAEYFDQPPRLADRLPPELSGWLSELRKGDAANGLGSDDAAHLLTERPGAQLSIRHLPATGPWVEDMLLLEERRSVPDSEELRKRGLTPREVEVLICAAGGRTDAQIAQELSISARTVQRHLQSTYRKLGAFSRTSAVATALSPEPGSASVSAS